MLVHVVFLITPSPNDKNQEEAFASVASMVVTALLRLYHSYAEIELTQSLVIAAMENSDHLMLLQELQQKII
jgi:hypothetical protein